MAKSTDKLTPTTIKQWAYKRVNAEVLPQLEQLGTLVEHSDLLFSLVSDQSCPQRAGILNCFYTQVGKSVSQHSTPDITLINDLLTKAASSQDSVIMNWVTRTKSILHDLRKYDYVEWCEGGFVRKDLA